MPEKKCPSAKQAERVKAQKGVHKLLKLFFYILSQLNLLKLCLGNFFVCKVILGGNVYSNSGFGLQPYFGLCNLG